MKNIPSLFLSIETKVIKRGGYLRTTHNTDTTLITTTKSIVVNNTTTSYPIQLTAQQTTYIFITLAVIIVGIALLIVTYITCHKQMLKRRKLNNNLQQLNDYINGPTFETQDQLDSYVLGPNHKKVNSLFGNK
ncbi:31987_t:CDS:2 [Gigaspora margarita]|uniref:31987_t:CDS:1 n=1 Tax=Gigaspora margarita TaxID=4874 RepID=A0ABN7UKA2_GIGMA|nr:31987_t:CDS:2 [Gigaspora margarita]